MLPLRLLCVFYFSIFLSGLKYLLFVVQHFVLYRVQKRKYCIVFEYILIILLLYIMYLIFFCVIISLTFYGVLSNVVLAGITALLVNYAVL